MKIFSYFHPVADLNVEDEIRLSILWRERWSAAGFEPVILNEHIAAKHPYFKEFAETVSKFPTTNPRAYEFACYARHLALAVAGGGFMADLDVFPNAGFTIDQVPIKRSERMQCSERMQIYQTPCCPSFFHCWPETSELICLEMAVGGANVPQNGASHTSDQYLLEQMVINKSPMVVVHDFVKQWPDDGWQKAPLIHFPNAAMAPRGKSPKWKHIPALLDEASKA